MSGSSSRDNGYGHLSSKRKQSSQSTPSSPTRLRKSQCTCAHDPSMQQLQSVSFQGRSNLKGINTYDLLHNRKRINIPISIYAIFTLLFNRKS